MYHKVIISSVSSAHRVVNLPIKQQNMSVHKRGLPRISEDGKEEEVLSNVRSGPVYPMCLLSKPASATPVPNGGPLMQTGGFWQKTVRG